MDAFIGSLTVSLRSGLIHSHASSPSPHALSFKWKTLHHQNSPGFLSLLSRSGWMSFQKQTNKLSWALLKGLNEWVLIHTCFYRANHPSRQRWVRIDPGVGGGREGGADADRWESGSWGKIQLSPTKQHKTSTKNTDPVKHTRGKNPCQRLYSLQRALPETGIASLPPSPQSRARMALP